MFGLCVSGTDKIIPINSGWFTPKKFSSSFIGKHAIKKYLQTATEATLTLIHDMLAYGISQQKEQNPTVSLFPNAGF